MNGCQIKLYLFVSSILLALATNVSAQLGLEAQYRNRLEFREGYRELSQIDLDPAVFMSQRTRLVISFKTDNLKLVFSPQDVRIWGDENMASSTGVFGNIASLDLFEGYFEIKAFSNAWISVGRQQLVYDNQRMLAARNWNQSGICYDALLIKITTGTWKAHIGGSWNSHNEYISGNDYPANRIKSLNFLWINRRFDSGLSASILHIASGITRTDTTSRLYFKQTSGIYGQFKSERFNVWYDFYYQYGKNNSDLNVSAYLFGADASFTPGKVVLAAGLEYLSGNPVTGETKTTERLFDVLYGARHRYFGDMDYFRNFSSHTREGGLADYYFRVEYCPVKSVNISNTGHYFRLAQTNLQTPADKDLGFENDFKIKYQFYGWGALEGGYAFIIPTWSLRSIQEVSSTRMPQFIYVQLTVNPKIL